MSDTGASVNKNKEFSIEIPEDDSRATVNLSLTASDKKKLKLIAMKQNITVSKLIHNFIEQYC